MKNWRKKSLEFCPNSTFKISKPPSEDDAEALCQRSFHRLRMRLSVVLSCIRALLLVAGLEGFKVPLCPVTSQSDFSNNYLYPVDIYDCKSGTHEAPDFDTVKCFSMHESHIVRSTSDPHMHNCSFIYKVPCPIDHQLLVDATKRTKSISPFSPLCHLKRALNDRTEVINVYFIGGSVTGGARAHGCCPSEECLNLQEQHCPRCTLPKYLGQYLNNTYRATVNLFNLGGMRGDPSSFARQFRYLVSGVNHNFSGFTSNDVVFLDYSANEAYAGRYFRDKKVVRDYECGAEALIRKVFMNSVPHSFPTVIYLANAANPYHKDSFHDDTWHFDHWYLELARHYNATVWSYRDAILAATESRDKQSTDTPSASAGASAPADKCTTLADRVEALDYLDFTHYGDRIHPSWHVHMFQSDLYAALWEHELHACDNPMLRDLDPSGGEWGMIFSSENLDFNRACARRTIADLPAELYGLSDMSKEVLCDKTIRKDPLLDLSYNILVDPHKVHADKPVFGTYKSTPEDGWRLAEDVVGRGGFISSTVGAKLTFNFFDLTYAQFHRMPDTAWILVEIEYLRTYENAGFVYLSICGENHVRAINGLWDDWQDYHVSYVQIAEFFIRQGECKLTTEEPISIELIYQASDQPGSRTPGNTEHFKAIAAMACFVDMINT